MEEYKYSEANITSFRLFSPEKMAVKELMQKMGYKNEQDDFRNGKQVPHYSCTEYNLTFS